MAATAKDYPLREFPYMGISAIHAVRVAVCWFLATHVWFAGRRRSRLALHATPIALYRNVAVFQISRRRKMHDPLSTASYLAHRQTEAASVRERPAI